MRIGLLGGTFNPIHNGHLKLAEEAHRQLSLDAVMLIPSYMPPHKEADDLLDAQQRLRMIELAISGNINFEIYRYEIDKEEKSYTVDTVEYIRSSCPEDTKIFFLNRRGLFSGIGYLEGYREAFQAVPFYSL